MSRKLYDQLLSEKPSLSYDDQHHGVTKSEEHSTLKSAGNHHKHINHGRESEEDELVKYMSNLPGYLERGKKNEKILNVGVLDWKRLEQWQYHHKHVPHTSSTSSVSTSNTPSSVSADRLFHQSLRSHFMDSPGHSDAIKSSRDNLRNSHNFRGSHINIGTHSKYLDDNISEKHPKTILKGCNRKYLDPHIDKEYDIFPDDRMHYEAASCASLGKPTQGCGMEKRVDTDIVLQHTLRKNKKFDLGLLRDSPQNNHCRVPDMPKFLVQKSGNSSRASFSEKHKELSHEDLNYDISHSCPLPDELRCDNFQLKGSGPCSTDLESVNFPASSFSSPLSTYSPPLSVKMGISPSRTRNADERKQTIAKTSSANGPPQGLDQKVTSDKSRSSSPFRRLSISIGYTSKGSACKEDEYVPHLSSVTARKYGDAGRSRSNPFRRLQDPLLKPKTTKSRHPMESSQEDSEFISENCRSADGNFSTLQPDKEVENDHRIDSSNGKKHVPSMTQALLRFAVRNGLPIFTFAVGDNTSNILAATVKNVSALEKDECNIVYTFFAFREVKKKNGNWMNQTGRSKGPDYIPHAVAQMKVSDSRYYNLTSQNCVDSSTIKEFVLFSVNLRQENAQATDYQPNDELAAIVVKIPKAISCINGWHHRSFKSDSQDPIRATVLIPSGVHSVPSKGGPSSLIERWKSGGSCDCGGWDLACKLKVIATENQPCRKPTSSKAYLANQLELFVQGNEQEHQRVFSFAPFKHGVYSIAFDSSLSLLQAFSICIALVDSKKPYDLFGSRNSIEDKNPRETLLVQAKELKAFGKLEDIPASYVSYPSPSPFGRV
ncbi:PREDICTED: uncharacterized protein LOC109325784 isoform X2 [Lupinus angustifolius]|uniref:uncharacterized protein LOC109325784 isoform X2 n=1 Tax=Lupinus angustifolius TaxID=3871 RepID=UPI00092F5CA3|nr:PREDICTED: uncharacterized protein LOC109325784 isoform X2 [Lupinus angustifolius]